MNTNSIVPGSIPAPEGKLVISDTYMAAYVLVAGHAVRGVEPEEGGRIGFVFDDSLAVQESRRYFLSNGLVPLQEFIEALHRLKRLLRQAEVKTTRGE